MFTIVFLRNAPAIALVPRDPGGRFRAAGAEYVALRDSDFTAFYDRIVVPEGIVGFQIQPIIEEELFLSVVARLSYAHVVPRTTKVRIHLLQVSGDSPEQILDDQAFGGRIFQSDDGEIAFSVDTSWFTGSDRARLETLNVDREIITTSPPD